jgi:hypothetical protein
MREFGCNGSNLSNGPHTTETTLTSEMMLMPNAFKVSTELHYGNLGSDPHWIRPIPTPFGAFLLNFPVGIFTT